MWNFAHTHKRLIFASIKTLQFKLLPPSAAKFKKHLTYQV